MKSPFMLSILNQKFSHPRITKRLGLLSKDWVWCFVWLRFGVRELCKMSEGWVKIWVAWLDCWLCLPSLPKKIMVNIPEENRTKNDLLVQLKSCCLYHVKMITYNCCGTNKSLSKIRICLPALIPENIYSFQHWMQNEQNETQKWWGTIRIATCCRHQWIIKIPTCLQVRFTR